MKVSKAKAEEKEQDSIKRLDIEGLVCSKYESHEAA